MVALRDLEVITSILVALCSLNIFKSFTTKARSVDEILYDVSISTLVLNIKPSPLLSKASARLLPILTKQKLFKAVANIQYHRKGLNLPWSFFHIIK